MRGRGPDPICPSPPLESLDNTFHWNTTCNLQCHGQNMKQSKLDTYICLVGWQTSFHWAYIYMSDVLTKNWKENGKAVKGLKSFFQIWDFQFVLCDFLEDGELSRSSNQKDPAIKCSLNKGWAVLKWSDRFLEEWWIPLTAPHTKELHVCCEINTNKSDLTKVKQKYYIYFFLPRKRCSCWTQRQRYFKRICDES